MRETRTITCAFAFLFIAALARADEIKPIQVGGGSGGGGMVDKASTQAPQTSAPVTSATTGGDGGGPAPSGDKLITKEEFNQAVTLNGYPAPSDEQYNNIVSRAGPSGQITTKQELAMFLANILHESDGLKAKKEYTPQPGAYLHPALDKPGKVYYGRGYIQLTWSYNYKAASQALFKDDRLLVDPDQVEKNDQIAWDTAFWFWSANVHSKPGVSEGKFGATTMAINGGLECKGGNQAAAKKRFEMYKKIFEAWKISGSPVENGCYN